MFSPGELIVCGRNGVCRVEKAERVEGQPYYCLQQLYRNCIIKVPVNGTIPMRPVLTRREAEALIDSIPAADVKPAAPLPQRELKNLYLASLNNCGPGELLAMTMSVYAKTRQAAKAGRRPVSTDGYFLREAVSLLYGELAVSLGIGPGEVPGYVEARLGAKEAAKLPG